MFLPEAIQKASTFSRENKCEKRRILGDVTPNLTHPATIATLSHCLIYMSRLTLPTPPPAQLVKRFT
jgi:hypothetical protein